MQIALCDDEQSFIDIINNKIQALSPEVEIFTFNNGSDLFKHISLSDESFDVVVLDIMMDAMDGISIARNLNMLSPDTLIIFITGHIDFVQVGYEVKAFRYLLKTQIESDLSRIWGDIVAELKKRSDAWFVYAYDREVARVKYSEIVCFESEKRVINIHHTKGISKFYGKLDALELELVQHGFLRCHKSYIINPEHIQRLMAGLAATSTSMIIPVSRKYAAAVNRRFTAGVDPRRSL